MILFSLFDERVVSNQDGITENLLSDGRKSVYAC